METATFLAGQMISTARTPLGCGPDQIPASGKQIFEFEDGWLVGKVSYEWVPTPAAEKPWHFPVGTVEYPPELWYVALRHGPSSYSTGGRHTGIDYNVQVPPRGDIDLGLPVWAVADGEIVGTWYSAANLGSVLIKVRHDGAPLWVRYWHLSRNELFLSWRAGMAVESGQKLGNLGDYPPGPRAGSHLHFDMARVQFHPGVWWTAASMAWEDWLDPVPILKAHLDEGLVEASLKLND